jgi:PPOX class probable F420-dependent enzyme
VAPRPLSGDEIAFLTGRKLARVATVGHDGVPHVVPVLFAYADGSLWFSSDPGDRKVRNLRQHAVAALVIDEPPPVKAGVTVSGEALVIDDGELFDIAQSHLQAAGAGGRRRMEPGEQVYVRLTPTDVASWRIERALGG